MRFFSTTTRKELGRLIASLDAAGLSPIAKRLVAQVNDTAVPMHVTFRPLPSRRYRRN
jgi:hypothetical protein